MAKQSKKEKNANHSLTVRILCIALSALICSTMLIYLVTMLMELFAK